MNFGKELAKEFKILTKGNKCGEVELFTKLEDSIINLSTKYPMLVEIIHGSKSIVKFNYEANYINKIQTPIVKECELGDMLFITFSKNKKIFRLMYMQNKIGKDWDRFYLDLIQLDLLNNKPSIISTKLPKCVFENNNILKNALLPSVTSYGVFYKDSDAYEMSYLLASKVAPQKLIGRTQRRMAKYVSNEVGLVKIVKGYEESQGEETLENFGNSLYNMQIGTPILVKDIMYDNIETFLRNHSFIWNYYDFNNEQNQILDNCPTICIINADYHMN